MVSAAKELVNNVKCYMHQTNGHIICLDWHPRLSASEELVSNVKCCMQVLSASEKFVSNVKCCMQVRAAPHHYAACAVQHCMHGKQFNSHLT